MKIIHLAQIHQTGGETMDEIEWIAEAQHGNALYLLEHPNALVFKEGVSENLTPQLFAHPDKLTKNLIARSQWVFPYGIPPLFDDLTHEQKSLLATLGAPSVLYYLGLRKEVLQTVPNKEEDKIFREIARLKKLKLRDPLNSELESRIKFLVFTKRERFAAQRALQASLQDENLGQEIIIVYGEAHDFAPHFEAQPGVEFARVMAYKVQDKPRDPMKIDTSTLEFAEFFDQILPPNSRGRDITNVAEFDSQILHPLISLKFSQKELTNSFKTEFSKNKSPDQGKVAELLSWSYYLGKDMVRLRHRIEITSPPKHLRLDSAKSTYLSQIDGMRRDLIAVRRQLTELRGPQPLIALTPVPSRGGYNFNEFSHRRKSLLRSIIEPANSLHSTDIYESGSSHSFSTDSTIWLSKDVYSREPICLSCALNP